MTRSALSYQKWPIIVTVIGLALSGWLGWVTTGTLSGLIGFLIIGGILALTLKDNDQQQVIYMPPNNNMMVNPSVTQMTSPQFEEPKKYDMPQTTQMTQPTYNQPPKGGL